MKQHRGPQVCFISIAVAAILGVCVIQSRPLRRQRSPFVPPGAITQ